MIGLQKQRPIYVMGHTEHELQRLIEQSRLFGDLTEQVFLNAGIGSGMRVLDLGCGAGDVSFLAAKLVGSSGAVIGVDKSPESIAIARSRTNAAQIRNVTFIESDLSDLSLPHPVDAVIGRLVLMYLPDPAATLRQLSRFVRAGGVFAFHEMDFTNMPPSLPQSPLYAKVGGWIVETMRRSGAEVRMGLKLYQTLIGAGLSAPQMIMGARVEGGSDSPIYELLAQTARSVLPMMEAFGVATRQEVRVETLAARLRDEVISGGGVIVSPYLVGAWARKPD